jgi:hypothetical protein
VIAEDKAERDDTQPARPQRCNGTLPQCRQAAAHGKAGAAGEGVVNSHGKKAVVQRLLKQA